MIDPPGEPRGPARAAPNPLLGLGAALFLGLVWLYASFIAEDG